jgi:hypothetical protein
MRVQRTKTNHGVTFAASKESKSFDFLLEFDVVAVVLSIGMDWEGGLNSRVIMHEAYLESTGLGNI